MTTPREDAIAALDVKRLTLAMDACLPEAFNASQPGNRVRAKAIAREYAALGAESETPDLSADPYRRGYSDGLHAALGQMPVGHWVDLASPETAEALARWLMKSGWVRDPDHANAEVESFLAAMRETIR